MNWADPRFVPFILKGEEVLANIALVGSFTPQAAWELGLAYIRFEMELGLIVHTVAVEHRDFAKADEIMQGQQALLAVLTEGEAGDFRKLKTFLAGAAELRRELVDRAPRHRTKLLLIARKLDELAAALP